MTTPSSAQMPGISERYEISGSLGQGGMARVYRALDRVNGREVALKQLTIDKSTSDRKNIAALFEREYLTLTQLRHPNVISVYDYGLTDEAAPYYTMELLDGGDLLERVPMPWQQACKMLFDVCSSLALLHSRRLLHRDISPRNVRCTRAGSAKLIDFGAMGPMTSGGAQVVGTPAFCAPETLDRLALDARTDLFSAGATLYYALTAQLPYPGRSFADMLMAWTHKVVPPSVLAADVPAALDDLVLALIHPEPALRPASAYEVMQRLAAVAGISNAESDTVSQAYLATPTLVGRSAALDDLRGRLMGARLTRGGGALIHGPSGIGRSRLLDACALEAKTLGFCVLRASASGSGERFGVIQALFQHLLEVLPQSAAEPAAQSLLDPAEHELTARVVKHLDDPALDPSAIQQNCCTWITRVNRTQPLLLAIDDIHRIDPPSAAVLAALLDQTRLRLFVALTSDSDAAQSDALSALSRRCQLLTPESLTREQTHELLGSLFGDVPRLSMLSSEVFEIAAGNPRSCIELAQHLLDTGLVRYDAGSWVLPQQLRATDLPRDAAATKRARLARLSAHALCLAEAQALSFFESFSDDDYHKLSPALSSAQVEQALSELLSQQVVVRDGTSYSLANRVWRAALVEQMNDEQRAERHRALSAAYEGRSSVAQVHHLFSAGMNEQGLDRLVRRQTQETLGATPKQLAAQRVEQMIWAYEPAIATAIALGRSAREINELRRWQLAGTIAREWGAYTESGRLWFEQLAHDSGLTLYREASQMEPQQRLTYALQTAYQRYQETPQTQRVYAVDEAIRLLAEYVVFCIALGGRAQDTRLLRTLPAILEPFAALAPALDAIWNNALATCSNQCHADLESAHQRWTDVLAKLDAMSGKDMQHIDAIRNAVVYALAMLEVQLGLTPASALTARLDSDPYQSIGALNVRKIERLEQGDWRGAEQFRRRAEVVALELSWPQMFRSLLVAELSSYARAGDLTGVQQVIEPIRLHAQHYSGWTPVLLAAEGSFHQVRGDLALARSKFESCIAMTQLDEQGQSINLTMWLAACAGLAEVLFELECFEEARATASRALATCEARQLGSTSFDLIRILALSEGKLDQMLAATQRVEQLIERQLQLGSKGLRLGMSYETRARLALWSGESDSFEHYAQLTAREYRRAAGSPLANRYERLMNEARRLGMQAPVQLPLLQSSTVLTGDALATQDLLTVVARSMAGKAHASERAQTAIELLCALRSASAAHLFLLTADGLTASASRGQPPDAALLAAAEELLRAERARAEALEEMVTGELAEAEIHTQHHSVEGAYELLVLSCVVDADRVPVGVVALLTDNPRIDSLKQSQLLAALASHLLPDATLSG